jgi:hypothetical protein
MLEKVDEQEKERRLSICRECQHYVSKVSSCGYCWCYLPMKASFKRNSCPIRKWASKV